MCARNRKMRSGKWAAVRDGARWVGDKVRTGVLALGLRGAALIGLAVIVVVGMYLARHAVGRKPEFRVYPSRFRAKAPPWCADDLAKVAFPRESYSIFDPGLTREVAAAYAASPWVAAVRRVEKSLPNKLVVELDLRDPAALIRLPGGYCAIDAEGIYLPLDYRRWDHQRNPLPEVYGVEGPPPKAGRLWDAPPVVAAAALMAALAEEPAVLEQIAIVDVTNLTGKINPRDSKINLYTRRWGTRLVIRWGAPPEPPGGPKPLEPTAAEKLAMLKERLARPLGLAGGASYIDLRFPDSGAVARHETR